MKGRIANIQLRDRVASPQEAAMSIKDGMTVAMGGVTASGYPKVIPDELIKRKAAGDDFQINLITGSTVGPEIDGGMGEANIIHRRTPMNDSRALSKLINQGKVSYIEQQIHKMPFIIQKDLFGKIDVAVVEAIGITKEGYIIPSASVGTVPHFVNMADTVIVEINLAQPTELNGMHDIYLPSLPPHRRPILLTRVNEKIGEPFIRVDPEKIKYIVASNVPDTTQAAKGDKQATQQITDHLLNFLELEVAHRMDGKLLPIQTGFGNLAADIVHAFADTKFHDISFFCGVLQEANFDLISAGRVKSASTSAIQATSRVVELIKQSPEFYSQIVTIRNSDITNCAETISRLGIVALNSAIEVDIYGNANLSHVMGTQVVNGIGGGANFAQNASLSILLVPSVTKGGKISTIVPMVSHNDINEHDIDVIITENGVADLRGKDEVERAMCIIHNCAGKEYKEQLDTYLHKAVRECGGHHPQLLSQAFSWHIRFKESGTMLEKSNS